MCTRIMTGNIPMKVRSTPMEKFLRVSMVLNWRKTAFKKLFLSSQSFYYIYSPRIVKFYGQKKFDIFTSFFIDC